jgi:hypothetical protein
MELLSTAVSLLLCWGVDAAAAAAPPPLQSAPTT